MKINRPTDERMTKAFGALCHGDCFEINGDIHIKIVSGSYKSSNAMRLAESGPVTVCLRPENPCTLVDVEISYAYRRQKETEHNG